jgi:hypothetical protein
LRDGIRFAEQLNVRLIESERLKVSGEKGKEWIPDARHLISQHNLLTEVWFSEFTTRIAFSDEQVVASDKSVE